MSPAEQHRRMKAMRDRLRAHDSYAWTASFMASLDSVASVRLDALGEQDNAAGR